MSGLFAMWTLMELNYLFFQIYAGEPWCNVKLSNYYLRPYRIISLFTDGAFLFTCQLPRMASNSFWGIKTTYPNSWKTSTCPPIDIPDWRSSPEIPLPSCSQPWQPAQCRGHNRNRGGPSHATLQPPNSSPSRMVPWRTLQALPSYEILLPIFWEITPPQFAAVVNLLNKLTAVTKLHLFNSGSSALLHLLWVLCHSPPIGQLLRVMSPYWDLSLVTDLHSLLGKGIGWRPQLEDMDVRLVFPSFIFLLYWFMFLRFLCIFFLALILWMGSLQVSLRL